METKQLLAQQIVEIKRQRADEEAESQTFLMAYLQDLGFTAEQAETMIGKGIEALSEAAK